MSNPNPNHTALRRLAPAEWAARREASIKRIAELLAKKPMTVLEVADACGLPRETARGHLAHMDMLGLAHRTGKRSALNRHYWAAGEKPDVVTRAGEYRTLGAPMTHVVVQRHWMDVALFGPARGAAA